MILSDRDIRARLAQGDLRIEPIIDCACQVLAGTTTLGARNEGGLRGVA